MGSPNDWKNVEAWSAWVRKTYPSRKMIPGSPSDAEYAAQVGCTQTQLQQWRRGKTGIPLTAYARMSLPLTEREFLDIVIKDNRWERIEDVYRWRHEQRTASFLKTESPEQSRLHRSAGSDGGKAIWESGNADLWWAIWPGLKEHLKMEYEKHRRRVVTPEQRRRWRVRARASNRKSKEAIRARTLGMTVHTYRVRQQVRQARLEALRSGLIRPSDGPKFATETGRAIAVKISHMRNRVQFLSDSLDSWGSKPCHRWGHIRMHEWAADQSPEVRAAYNAYMRPKWTARTYARRAVENGLNGSFEPHELYEQYKRWGYRCAYCGKTRKQCRAEGADLTADHVIPLVWARDSEQWSGVDQINTIENIVPACQSCNYSKHDKDPMQWMQDNHGLRPRVVAVVDTMWSYTTQCVGSLDNGD